MQPLNKHTADKPWRPERIIQLGEGNFLRAFADWIIGQMNERTTFNSSVVVVQPIEKGMADRLNEQDGLYHVNLQGLDNGRPVNSLTLVNVISRVLNPYTQFDAFRQLAGQPEMRFVLSNTTEAGIVFDPSCRLTDTPAASFPGKLTQLLYHRYLTFRGDRSKGLLIFPCELIFHNGRVLKEVIHQYIAHWQLEAGFRSWFDEACGVYNTLVDRIVPGFPAKEIETIQRRLGYADQLVVQAEHFHLWVIEAPEAVAKEFPAAEAGLNVRFVANETPYHQRKVTLLNGPHTVLSPVAFLSGIDLVRDACEDEDVGRYIRRVMYDELPVSLSLPQEEIAAYTEQVWERFINPFVDHRVTSILLNSFPKFKTRDLPGLKAYLKHTNTLPPGIVLGLAALITYYKGGTRADGVSFQPDDAPAITALLTGLWQTADTLAVAKGVLGATFIWEEDLNTIPGLTAQVQFYLDSIQSDGMRQTLHKLFPATML